MSLLWPRLEAPIAAALVESYRALPLAQVAEQSQLSHPKQTFASSGGTRASVAQLEKLRESIIEVAERHGYPNRAADPVRFDREMAPVLFEAMPMPVGEALSRPVWSFAAVVLAPHITYWRFVSGSSWNLERWVCSDRTRHMFARCWWQARQLTTPAPGGRDTSLLDALSESELNHITERTSIGGCGPLARAIARQVTALPVADRQRDTVREACKLALRRTAFIDPYALDERQLEALAESAMAAALATTPVPLPPPSGAPVASIAKPETV